MFIVVSSLACSARGTFGVEVSVSTKGALPPKLQTITIAKVAPNSAADNAGIEVGDKELAINGCEPPGCCALKAR
ncbi:PDZ domain-containing protein [Halioxenophilus aromaticivorans]|uniref:PDZ domain-containing protein n=1 Tax=Halioxenophilus aromaticivorans TaxID=1306992 RepID=A0AAV3U5E2_9ALTE